MQAFLRDARDFLPILLQGCVVTVELMLAALVLSTLLGFVWALLRLSPSRALSAPAVAIITVIRGIPILVQLFYIYFVLPDLGIQLSAPASRLSIRDRSRPRNRSACGPRSSCAASSFLRRFACSCLRTATR